MIAGGHHFKACPFCGGFAYFWTEEQRRHSKSVSRCAVECTKCGASTGWQRTDDLALAAWNRRQADEARGKAGEET